MTAAARASLLTLVCLVLTPVVLADDVIRLKNGRSISGRIVEESADKITIEIPGAGRMTVARSDVKEVIREAKKGGEEEADVEGVIRAEHYFVWNGLRRVGYRSLWVRKLRNGGFQCEEESVFTDDEGKEEVVLRIVEKVTSTFEPLEIDYRERSAEGQVARRGVVREGKLYLETSLPGERRKASLTLPGAFRFPISAREFAIRERERLKGAWEVVVFDPREENFFKYAFEVAGKRRVDWEGSLVEVSVLRRRRGDRAVEEIWVDSTGRVVTEELNGPELVAILSTRERVQAAREGGRVDATEEEKRVRPLFVHPEAGFKVRKPTISWVFERQKEGSRKVLSISNVRFFAFVDFFILKEQPEGGLLSALAVDMEKRFSASSAEFKKLSDGYLEVGGTRAYKMVASSRNKGEELRSLLVGVLHGGQTILIAMACPQTYWEGALPEFEAILSSFEFIDDEEGGGEK